MSLAVVALLRFGFLIVQLAWTAAIPTKPNIVIILADDLGWNDVSFHGSDQIPTPNIDALAYNGIILNSHYTPALCTPSRAALLTGKYPTSLGLQHLVILGPEPRGLPLSETLMPEYFRSHGYATHAVGKWHLGFHQKEFTPTFRGFDTHFGYWNGYQDYFDHTTLDEACIKMKGFDMRRNMALDYSTIGTYSTDLFTSEAVNIIKSHNQTKGPMFLYFAHLAVHSGNPDKPYQSLDSKIAKFPFITDLKRKVYAGMLTSLDESVGKVFTALRENNMLDNSIVIFLSDNGAVTFGMHSNSGSNYPFRGLKESPWEGGIRCVAAVWSPFLNRTKRVSNQLMHISDWLPTLYSAAGFDVTELGEIDGHDMWMSLSHDLISPRTEILHNIDEIENYTAFTYGPWKYVEGTTQNGAVDEWYGDPGLPSSPNFSSETVLKSETNVAISGWIIERKLARYLQPTHKEIPELLTSDDIIRLRIASKITCPETLNVTKFISMPYNISNNLKQSPYLFHIQSDPCEFFNLAEILPDTLKGLKSRVEQLKKTIKPPANIPCSIKADPSYYDGAWTTWSDIPVATQQYTTPGILFKILTAPVSGLVTLMTLWIKDLIDSLVSLVTVIVILVFTFICTNFVSKLLVKQSILK